MNKKKEADLFEALSPLGEEERHAFMERLFAAEAERDLLQKKNQSLLEQLGAAKLSLQESRQIHKDILNTVSYKLGRALAEAPSSWRSMLGLPARLWRLAREDAERQSMAKEAASSAALESSVPVVDGVSHPADLALPPPPLRIAGERPQIALVSGAALRQALSFEASVCQLDQEGWERRLAACRPDLVLVSSCGLAKEGSESFLFAEPLPWLRQMLYEARKLGVPSAFWNTEDPVNCGGAMKFARLADYVFTVDIDCIPLYKQELGHDRAGLLPLAIQPALSNPLTWRPKREDICFAGASRSYDGAGLEDFDALVGAVKDCMPVVEDAPDQDDAPEDLARRGADLPSTAGDRNEGRQARKSCGFSVCVNAIKQSQSVFAPETLESLASNSLVVSNYSRALHCLFGDLTLSTDNRSELRKSLQKLLERPQRARKLRLLGLRKVMTEHVYARRLSYLLKLMGAEKTERPRAVHLLAAPADAGQFLAVKAHFDRQRHPCKRLIVLGGPQGLESSGNIARCASVKEASELLAALPGDDFFGALHAGDHYGPHYLTDLVLAFAYSRAAACGKKARYEAVRDERPGLINDGAQYRMHASLEARCSLTRLSSLAPDWLEENATRLGEAEFTAGPCLAVDEFNYVRNGGGMNENSLAEAMDLPADTGCSLEDMQELGARLPAAPLEAKRKNANVFFMAHDLFALIKDSLSAGAAQAHVENRTLLLRCKRREHASPAAHLDRVFTRQELGLENAAQYALRGERVQGLQTFFVFLDAKGVELFRVLLDAGHIHTLPIPENCRLIRVALQAAGENVFRIKEMEFGHISPTAPALVSKSPYLAVAKQYPDYDDLYSYAFLHSRIRAYREHGLHADVFKIGPWLPVNPYYEFEGVDVCRGTAEQLTESLRLGKTRHVMIHMLDRVMWKAVKPLLDAIKVTVWVHGAEIQPWERRAYEAARMSPQEILRRQKDAEARVEFWREIFNEPHPNLTFVFVSRQFKEEALADIGVEPSAAHNVEVIHNYIDGDLFAYRAKKAESRLNIVSIRPYQSLTYANDLTVKAIVRLSRRPFFKELRFLVAGDGPLFRETVEPLRDFANVRLEQRFMTHYEMAALYADYGVFLCPTRSDTQGVSRGEAMAAGLVPVTSAVGAVPEFVDESCGLLTPPEDDAALADAVEKLYYNPELFLRLSAAAAKRARDQLGFAQTIGKEMALLRS